jgi:hypothetical protein
MQRRAGARLTAGQHDYLIGHLAGRRDWAGLWRLVQDLPLAQAVAAVRLLDAGWSPADDPGRALLRRLARADPDAIATAGQALAAPTTVSIDLDDVPTHGSFSPDGRQLLVATERGGRYSGCRVFELPGGTLVERHDYQGTLPPAGVVHLGAALLLVGRRPDGASELVRYSDGRPHVLHRSPGPMTVASYPGASYPGASHPPSQTAGFVVLDREGPGWRLGFRDTAGAALRDVPLDYPPSPPEDVRVAVDAGTGRLAVTGASLWIIGPDGAGVLGRTPPAPAITAACFPAPDHAAAIDATGQVRLYRLARHRLARHRLELRASTASQPELARGDIVAIPQRGEIAVRSGADVRYLNAASLTEVTHDRDPARGSGTALWGSADGRSHAAGGRHPDGRGFVHVIWGGHASVTALADRPVGAMTASDLSLAEAALRGPIAGVAARPFLHLLRECLRHRGDAGEAGLLADTRPGHLHIGAASRDLA